MKLGEGEGGDNHRVAAITCARRGARQATRRSTAPVAGKPLMAEAIEEAVEYCVLDPVTVCPDRGEVAEVTRRCGAHVPVKRPAELAQDDVLSIALVLHAVRRLPGQQDDPSDSRFCWTLRQDKGRPRGPVAVSTWPRERR